VAKSVSSHPELDSRPTSCLPEAGAVGSLNEVHVLERDVGLLCVSGHPGVPSCLVTGVPGSAGCPTSHRRLGVRVWPSGSTIVLGHRCSGQRGVPPGSLNDVHVLERGAWQGLYFVALVCCPAPARKAYCRCGAGAASTSSCLLPRPRSEGILPMRGGSRLHFILFAAPPPRSGTDTPTRGGSGLRTGTGGSP
jgi:hypothetical protein